MTSTVGVLCIAVAWFAVGVVTAIRAWRRGDLDIISDGIIAVEHGVVDKAMWAWIIVLFGPIWPISDYLSKLNEQTKPNRCIPHSRPSESPEACDCGQENHRPWCATRFP